MNQQVLWGGGFVAKLKLNVYLFYSLYVQKLNQKHCNVPQGQL